MLAQEVARKYAHALFLSVMKKNLLNQADEQFLDLGVLLNKDRTLLNFLAAPQVSDEKKLALVRDVFGSRLERLLVEFLIVLVNKHRVNYLPEIVEEFDRQIKTEKGIGKVTVVTAVPLRESEEQALRAKLATRTGLKIELEKKVDPSILGGMIIVLHNQIIDGSVRHGLDMIHDQLEKTKVH